MMCDGPLCNHDCGRPVGHKGRCDCYRADCEISLSHAYSKRRPPAPETLVDALQDRVAPASGPLIATTPIKEKTQMTNKEGQTENKVVDLVTALVASARVVPSKGKAAQVPKKPFRVEDGAYVTTKKTFRVYKCVGQSDAGSLFRYVAQLRSTCVVTTEDAEAIDVLQGPAMILNARKVVSGIVKLTAAEAAVIADPAVPVE